MTPNPIADAGTEQACSEQPSLLRPLLWVAVVAVAVRLPHLLESVGSVFFGVPILDEAFYDLVASRLADGVSIGDVNPGFRPLLYPALLALCRVLSADHGAFLALAAQHSLGVATCLLVALFAGRLFRRRTAALVAGVVFALAGPPLFYEGRLLIATLFTFLVVALLVVLGHCRPTGSPEVHLVPWLVAGALMALAVQARANALVFLLAFPLIGGFTAWRAASHPRRHLPWIAATGATLIGLALLAAVQAALAGRLPSAARCRRRQPLPGQRARR